MSDTRPVIQLAHSPDPDDAFMWWPLFETDGAAGGPRLDTGPFRYVPVLDDIESLNVASESGAYEITAISCAQYPRVKDRYALTSCGASMGDRYGPKLIAAEPITVADLIDRNLTVLAPGERTSALTALRALLAPHTLRYETAPFETIIDRVVDGPYPVGLVIHEGQLTFADSGLHLVRDLGEWWSEATGLPMPLGVNTIRRDLEDQYGPGTLAAVTAKLLESVEYALAHRDESIAYALRYARGMPADLADEFVSLYVNKWTLDFGEEGERAVRAFLTRAADAGITPDPGEVTFIRPAVTT